jgi:2-oxo-4-hydroxy-4-carboxy-5-ureidoimidazoline decarboxylase
MNQQRPINTTLANWNRLGQAAAAQAILPCNGSMAWAAGMARRLPLGTPEALFAVADEIWLALPEEDWQQAFDSHPRIGEHKARAATAQSLKWSTSEQGTASPDTATQAALAAANREYEQRFGRIFIVCATGKSAAEMLSILRTRLANDPATELKEAAEQQRQITQIRLRKWLGIA